MLIATSATQLSRLGITNDRVLVSSGGLFSWSNTLPAFTLGGTLTIGGQTFDAGAGSAQINTTSGSAGLIIQSTQDGATGAKLDLYTISANPNALDKIAYINFMGKDAGGNDTTYAQMYGRIINPAEGAEDGALIWQGMNAGAWNELMSLSGAGELWVDADIDFSTSIDSALVADHVSLGCFDIGGLRSLAISQENPVVNVAAGASDNYLPIRVNGATFKLLLHS